MELPGFRGARLFHNHPLAAAPAKHLGRAHLFRPFRYLMAQYPGMRPLLQNTWYEFVNDRLRLMPA